MGRKILTLLILHHVWLWVMAELNRGGILVDHHSLLQQSFLRRLLSSVEGAVHHVPVSSRHRSQSISSYQVLQDID